MKIETSAKNASNAVLIALLALATQGSSPAAPVPEPAGDSLNRGLVLHYPFNGNLKDASGNGNDATGSQIQLGPDRHGVANSALRFNGTGAFARSANPPQVSGKSPRTISLWFAPEGSMANFAKGSVAGILLQWGNGSHEGADCTLMLGAFREIVLNGHYCTLESQRNVVPPRGWSHLVFIYPGNFQSAKFILNGQVLAVSQKGSAQLNTPANVPLMLGRNGNNGKSPVNLDDGWCIPWRGLIDEVRIYDRAIEIAEAKKLFETERAKGGAEGLMLASAKTQATPSPTDELPGANSVATDAVNPAPTQIPPVTAAPALPSPTNNVAELSHGKGEVIVFDSKGIVFKPGGLFKRVPIKDLTESDLRAVLETPKGFQALGQFKGFGARIPSSEAFEARLDEFWEKGKTLHEKLTARLAILETLRGYNEAVTTFARQSGFTASAIAQIGTAEGQVAAASVAADRTIAVASGAADRAAVAADSADRVKFAAEILKSDSRRMIGVSQSQARRSAKAADQAYKAANAAETAAYQAANAAEAAAENAATAAAQAAANNAYRMATAGNSCDALQATLISMGFPIPSGRPYGLIPSLSATAMIDKERGKK